MREIIPRKNKKDKDKLTDKQMQQLAEEAGKSIHKTVKLFTGVDLHEAVKL